MRLRAAESFPAVMFDLFAPEPQDNLLPFDGVVRDYGLFLTQKKAASSFDYFYRNLAWRRDEVHLHGKHIVTERKTAWYGDLPVNYAYSGVTRHAVPWDEQLAQLSELVGVAAGCRFNSCLANLYENGTQGMGWHSDNDMPFCGEVVIASLSLGAVRKFCFRHKRTRQKVEMLLHPGQLVVMRGDTQTYWQHAVMKSVKINAPRINLTFRRFGTSPNDAQ